MSKKEKAKPRLVRRIKAICRAFAETVGIIWKAFFGNVFYVVICLLTLTISLIFRDLYWPLVALGVAVGYTILVAALCWYGKPLEFLGMFYKLHLAKAYQSYGMLDLSEPLLENELDSCRGKTDALSESKRDLMESVLNLQYIRQGKLVKSEEHSREVYDKMRSKCKDDHLILASLPYHANTLATIYIERGKFLEGEELLAESRAQLERDLRADSPAYGTALLGLAQSALEQHKFQEAESLANRFYRHWQDGKKNAPSNALDNHPDRAVSHETELALYHWLSARLTRNNRKYEESKIYLDTAIDIFKDERLQLNLSLLFGELFVEQGSLNLCLGKYEEAEKSFQQGLDYYEKRTQYYGTDRGQAIAGRAYARFLLSKPGDAIEEIKKGLAMHESQVLANAPGLTNILMFLTHVYQSKGMLEDAEATARRALASRATFYPDGDLDLADTRVALAEILVKKGKSAEALEEYEKALMAYSGSPDEERTKKIVEWIGEVRVKSA